MKILNSSWHYMQKSLNSWGWEEITYGRQTWENGNNQNKPFSSKLKSVSRLRRGSFHNPEKNSCRICVYLNSISQTLRVQETAWTQNTAQQELEASNAWCVQTTCHNDFCLQQRTSPTCTFWLHWKTSLHVSSMWLDYAESQADDAD